MIGLFNFFLFVLGLIWGSFLNVVIFRWTSGQPLVNSRSHCLSCGKTLRWFELVPLISFFLQGGRCRTCKAEFSWQYPIVEFLSAIAVLVSFQSLIIENSLEIGNWKLEIFKSLWLFILLSCFLVLFFIDWRERLLPIFFSLGEEGRVEI